VRVVVGEWLRGDKIWLQVSHGMHGKIAFARQHSSWVGIKMPHDTPAQCSFSVEDMREAVMYTGTRLTSTAHHLKR